MVLTGTALLAAHVVSAQSIRGSVVRPSDGAGIPGVVVLLLDARDSIVARALTNERGEYRVSASGAGTYRERTLRIGYRPFLSEPFALAIGQEVVRRLSLAALAFSLDTVRVVNVNSCDVRADSATATFAIWEQVRTALTATVLSSTSRSSKSRVVTYDRTLDADGRRVREQHSSLNGNYSVRPWQAQSVEGLHTLGYVRDEPDGGRTYLAPDLAVLLSDTFLDDHCFRIARSDDGSRIGLEFEPSRARRSVPDIRGTIWLHRTNAELDRVDFKYANIAREEMDGDAGGTLAFARMSTGEWAIARWSIRMPVLERRETGGFGAPRGWALRLAEIKIAGGELALVVRGRDTLWARTPLVLSGITVDSTSGRPLAGALVSVLGAAAAARSDTDGRFTISALLPGIYSLEVRTPSLDAVGAVLQRELTFTDAAEPVRVNVPSGREVASSACSARPSTARGIVTGTVSVRGDTIPPSHVGMLAEWTDVSADVAMGGRANRSAAARTDARGRFWLCGVPLQKAVTIRVVNDSLIAEPVSVRIADGILGRADLVADRIGESVSTFTGIVVADSTNEPVGDAEVVLKDLALLERTNALGAFHFGRVPAGTHTVIARRVGFAPLETTLLFSAGRGVDKRIVLSRFTALDSVHVVAETRRLGVGYAAFEERRRMGFGRFIDSETLRNNEYRRMQDLLRALPGVSVYTTQKCTGRCESPPLHMQIAYNTRMGCYFRVWLDGVVVGKGEDAPPAWRRQFDLNAEVLGNIEAIEVYRGAGEVPTEYSGASSQCGVILLWSRNSR